MLTIPMVLSTVTMLTLHSQHTVPEITTVHPLPETLVIITTMVGHDYILRDRTYIQLQVLEVPLMFKRLTRMRTFVTLAPWESIIPHMPGRKGSVRALRRQVRITARRRRNDTGLFLFIGRSRSSMPKFVELEMRHIIKLGLTPGLTRINQDLRPLWPYSIRKIQCRNP